MKEEREEPVAGETEQEEPHLEVVDEDEAVGEPEQADVDGRLELDRMEVRGEEEPKAQPVEPPEPEPAPVEPEAPEERPPAGPGLLARLAGRWVWILGTLACLAVLSAVLLFVLVPERKVRQEAKLGKRVHVVNASLGGEHYVLFNLYGPFRHPKGLAALQRGMPKIRNDLIVSGGDPRVSLAIKERDLYFLEGHILEIVGEATGIPVEKMDLKGLSITRYSDETEVEDEG